MLEKLFKLQASGTTVKREVLAGITTFMTAAYIIAVNPSILSQSGMPFGSVMVATCLAGAFSTLVMGLYANYPFVLCAAMGLNAFFAFTVVGSMGIPWHVALTAVFIEGLIFIALTLTKLREAIIQGFPKSLQFGMTGGIGFFIALIGLKSAGLILPDSATLATLGDLTDPSVLCTIAGIILTLWLHIRRVPGSILIGVLFTFALAVFCGLVPAPKGFVSMPPSIAPTFFKLDFSQLAKASFWGVVFTLFFVDFFDTVGMLVGLTNRAGMLDEKGQLPRAKRVLLCDALGTTFGAIVGTSTVTTMVESASGVEQGGRTGLTAVVTGLLFLAALFLSPLIESIPAFATAPALITVGLLMMSTLLKLDSSDGSELFPALISVMTMAYTYSIGNGIEMGVLSYVAVKIGVGKSRDVSKVMYFLALAFIAKELANAWVF